MATETYAETQEELRNKKQLPTENGNFMLSADHSPNFNKLLPRRETVVPLLWQR
jgi:hypothetical protein